jgi:hypothetical protein
MLWWLVLALALLLPGSIHAQGCSLCRDSTAGSPPRLRQAIRRAIFILGIPAAGVFAGILVIALRSRPREQDSPNPILPV